jgi:formyl-CoA transferase
MLFVNRALYTICLMATAGPLDGIRVLELGAFIAGPFAGQLLGDYGAEVIKIEQPTTGDPMREWGVTLDGESLWWPAIARNKQCVGLDLRDARARDVVLKLAANCDVIVENFRPGRLDDWGLTYEALAANNPALVLVRVSGYGQTGPLARQAGFGSIGEAMGGIRHTTGFPDRPPTRTGTSLGDGLASLFAVIGALAALQLAQRTGAGQVVDVAIYEAVAAMMESTMADYEVGDSLRGRTGSILPGTAPSNVYSTSDHSEVLIAGNADAVFARLCTAMNQPELSTDARFATHIARGSNQELLDGLINDWTLTLDSTALLEVLEKHSVPAGRIFTARDMLADPQYLARGMVQRLLSSTGHEVPMNGVVPRFERTPGSIRHVGPTIGAHTDDVLMRVAGLSADEVGELRAAGLLTSEDGRT